MVRVKTLDAWIDAALALTVASSFFIFPDLGWGVQLFQPFYFFLGAAALGSLIKWWQVPDYRQESFALLRKYGVPLAFFIGAAGINIFFYSVARGAAAQPPFAIDLYRTILLMVFFGIILLQGTTRWIKPAFFTAFALTPVLFITNLETLTSTSTNSSLIFNGYKLQGLQGGDPTALATWLLVPFAICAVEAFNPQRQKKLRALAVLGASIIMALIWWSNSRGAIIMAIVFLLTLTILARYREQTRLIFDLGMSVLILFLSIALLPQQARGTVFGRFYPQEYGAVVDQDFRVSNRVIFKKFLSEVPDLTSGQSRGELWADCPRYVLTHPFGEYGPELPPYAQGTACGQHNSLFQAAFWAGWIGIVVIGWLAWQALIRMMQLQPLWIALAFAGILAQAFLNSFLQLKVVWIVLALLLISKSELAAHKEKV